MRALAIGLVCLSHIVITQSGGTSTGIARWFSLGDFGVQIFFVLSGFLITTLLIRELDTHHTISLRAFYFRRTMRIFPAFYAFLGAIVFLDTLGIQHFDFGDARSVAVYVSDYVVPNATTALSHCWSLAVEEQFYLLWPAVLLLLGRGRAARLAIIVLALSPLVRLTSLTLGAHGLALAGDALSKRFDTHADSLAAGCLLALLRPTLHAIRPYRRFLGSPYFYLAPVSALALREWAQFASGFAALFSVTLGYGLISLCIAVSIDGMVTCPERLPGRLLNWRPIAFLGVLSYSLYLWQQIFLLPVRPTWFSAFPLAIPVLLCVAAASYFLAERPALLLRERVEHRFRTQRRANAPESCTDTVVRDPGSQESAARPILVSGS